MGKPVLQVGRWPSAGISGGSFLEGDVGNVYPDGQRRLPEEFKLAKALEGSSPNVNLC